MSITIFALGLVLGASIVAVPLVISLKSNKNLEETVEKIEVQLEEEIAEDLEKSEYKISGKPSDTINKNVIQHAKKSVRDQYVVDSNQTINLREVHVKPDEWKIYFELSE